MLPFLRMISVGGVLLAITVTALALSPPGGSHMQFSAVDTPSRGALIDRGKHPEWRQFLILAAVRRSDELNRLRDLPDTPTRLPEIPNVAPPYTLPEFPADTFKDTPKVSPTIAGLPTGQPSAVPDDETGSVNAVSHSTIPIEIGEPSSTELPVAPVEDRPPVITIPLTKTPEPVERPTIAVSTATAPEQIKPSVASRKRSAQRRHSRVAAAPPTQTTVPPPFNILQAIFEALLSKPSSVATKPPVKSTVAQKRRIESKLQPVIRTVSQ